MVEHTSAGADAHEPEHHHGRQTNRLTTREARLPSRRGRNMMPRAGVVGRQQQIDVRDNHERCRCCWSRKASASNSSASLLKLVASMPARNPRGRAVTSNGGTLSRGGLATKGGANGPIQRLLEGLTRLVHGVLQQSLNIRVKTDSGPHGGIVMLVTDAVKMPILSESAVFSRPSAKIGTARMRTPHGHI